MNDRERPDPPDDAPDEKADVDSPTETFVSPDAVPRPVRPGGKGGEALGRGTVLGRYVVLDVIGRGGMGMVYAAYDPELNRKVALKVLRPRTGKRRAPREVQGRLLREAQALAKLQHPNVITIYDVGSFDRQVFLAMELVDGMTLGDWLREKPRTYRQILEIFSQAGRGLEAAHSAGLVHRDFKPGNVMVDREGNRALVLDFSLAREENLEGPEDEQVVGLENLDDSSTAVPSPFESSLTRTGAVLGTPAYMAPEQHAGRPAGAAADQFAFCVTLYQALYKELPFLTLRRFQSLDERDWKVTEPPAGSRVPARTRRILLRGLRVDPTDRYSSMGALLHELSSNPWESHRRWLAAAALLVVACGVVWGYRQNAERKDRLCRGAEEKLIGVWDAERRRAFRDAFRKNDKIYAEDVWKATESALDDYTEAWVKMHTEACEATHLRGEQSAELLDLRVDCLDQRSQEVAALVGVLEADTSRLDRSLEAANALTPLSACADTLALTAPVRPPSRRADLDRVRALREKVAQAKAHHGAGNYDRGLEIATVAVAEAEELGYWPLTAEALLRQGILEGSKARPEPATDILLRGLEAAVAGGHERAAADILIRLVREVGYRQADFEQGLRYAAQATAVLDRLSQSREQEWLLADNVGTVYFHQGEYDKALEHHLRALELKESNLGPVHIDLANTLIRAGNVLEGQGAPEKALAYFDRAFRITEEALGPHNPRVAQILDRLGRAHFHLARYDLAGRYLERALEVTAQALGPRHSQVATNLMHLGTLDLTVGRYAQALERYEEALAILESSLGAKHPQVAIVQSNIALALTNLGEHQQAIETFQRALAIQKGIYGDEHPWIADTVFNLGLVYKELGEFGTYLDYSRRAAGIWQNTVDADHPRLAFGLTGIGEGLVATGSAAEALSYLERALEIRLAGEHDSALTAETRFALAQALAAVGSDERRAIELARQALDGFRQAPARDRDVAVVESWLASRGEQALAAAADHPPDS